VVSLTWILTKQGESFSSCSFTRQKGRALAVLSALLIFHSLRTKGRGIAAPTPLGTHRGVSNPTAPGLLLPVYCSFYQILSVFISFYLT
jgi:hypothetical protein